MRSFAVEFVRLCVWLGLLGLVFIPLERIFTLRRGQKALRKLFWLDLAYYFLNGLLPKLALIAPLTLVSGLAHRYFPADFYLAMESMPFWMRLPLAVVFGEIGTYWAHRWAHTTSWLWRFHAIHHGAEELDWLVNTRAHPVDVAFTRLCGLVPIYVLGLAQPSASYVDLAPVLLTIGGTVWGFLLHANLNWRMNWIAWLVTTPAFHHWHHANEGSAANHRNFAATLPAMDRLFGTYRAPASVWPDKYGIDEMLPVTITGQLVGPLTHQDRTVR